MITKEQRRELKKHLGPRYTKGVLEILKKQGVVNPNGEVYTSGSVRNVLAGQQENETIESAIYDFVSKKKKKAKLLEKKRIELLKSNSNV
ncbi:hypothetical protein [Aquimarina algiphila]|uniref:hypothetical protein n=1 Tax=Aquimarina algiphila TaxID=2047982 RepID=UPI00249105D5|nr:hypothetical protein [Aquimarina algiphila]